MDYAKQLSALLKSTESNTFLKTNKTKKTTNNSSKSQTVDDKYDENDFYNGTINLSNKDKTNKEVQTQTTKTLKNILKNLSPTTNKKNISNTTTKTDTAKENSETKNNTNVISDKNKSKEINKTLKNILNKLDEANKPKNTNKTNNSNKTNNNSNKSIDEVIKGLNIYDYETINGKVDETLQQASNCWLLSAINTFIDDGEGALKNIVKVSNSGEITVTFKSSKIYFYDKNGELKLVEVKPTPITVTPEELNQTSYNGYYLALGDQEVRAIEIAYYKLVSSENLDEMQTNGAGLQLLYGDNVETFVSFASYYASGDTELASLYQYLYETIENVDLNKYKNKNATAITSATSETGATLSSSGYKSYLDYKKDLLLEGGKFTASDIENAYNICLNRKDYGVYNTGLYGVEVPTKDGKTMLVYDVHAYTITNISNGYVTLINPHDNTVSYEIPEVIFRLLFNQISVVN